MVFLQPVQEISKDFGSQSGGMTNLWDVAIIYIRVPSQIYCFRDLSSLSKAAINGRKTEPLTGMIIGLGI